MASELAANGSGGSREPALWALVDEWLDERHTLGRGIAVATEAAYRRDLTVWAQQIGDIRARPQAVQSDDRQARPAGFEAELGRLCLADLTRDAVTRAMAELAREGRAPASRARMLAALRGFCAWLVENGYLSTDPTVRLQSPRSPERLPVAFTSDELRTIVRTASTADPTARFPWPQRDRALVAVLAGAGLRATECTQLMVADLVREADPYLRVMGKGGKERRVPLPPEVVTAVDAYLADRGHRLGRPHPTDRLFVRYNGRGLTREALNYHVVGWVRRAGVRKPEGEAAHAFRHTYAKGLVTRGVPISAVQKLLGHANLATTEVYLRMTAAELHEAAQAAEVREALRETEEGVEP